MIVRNPVIFLLTVFLCAGIPTLQADVPAEETGTASIPSFRYDIMAVLSKCGCNLGTCHGNQHGKGGLKLSLRGQDPEADFFTLTRQLAARRANLLVPDDSLLLRKPSMQVPHEGGRRFSVGSMEFQ